MAENSEILLKYSRGVAINQEFIASVFDVSVASDGAAETFFNNLTTKIEYHTDKFALQLGSEAEYKVSESWFNFYNKYDYQEYHYHPLSFFSAIYFFKNPENAGKTIFKSYEEPNMLPLKNLKRNELSQSNCHYIPRERTLLIFKSNLLHMVSQSQSDEPRITASFNLV